MIKILFPIMILSNLLLADQMSNSLKEGCKIIVQSNATKWTSKSVPSAYYIHGLTDMNFRSHNLAGLKINTSLVQNYNDVAYITCKQSLSNNENVDFREKLYFYNTELISTYYTK